MIRLKDKIQQSQRNQTFAAQVFMSYTTSYLSEDESPTINSLMYQHVYVN